MRRNNDELVATFGNLAHRVLTQAYRNFDGRTPDPGQLTDADEEMMAKCGVALGVVAQSIEAVRLREGRTAR